MSRLQLDYFVLDAVADEVEAVPHIRTQVARWGVNSGPLLEALQRLTADGLIEACVLTTDPAGITPIGIGMWPVGALEDLWFRITPHGLMVHNAWEPDERAGPA